jgi:hypothetical protein
MRYERTKRASGQAILWFLATAAACCAVMIGIFNVGQLTSEKQKVVNAADAAAYSGALVEARTLNFMAYSNRLMVTTEVLVAQTVSMSSWVHYARNTTRNIKTVSQVASLIPVVGAAFAAISKVLEAVQKALDSAIKVVDDVMVPIVVRGESALVGAYKLAMVAAASPATPLEAQDTAARVVAANKTTFGGRTDHAAQIPGAYQVLDFAINAKEWAGFTTQFKGADRKYAAEAIKKSRDAFSNDPCSDSPNCRGGADWMNISVAGVAGTEKYGGTKLSKDFNRWEAQDQFDFWIWAGKKKYTPVGWGRATLAEKETKGDIWPGGKGRPSSSLAYAENKAFKGWKGIPELYDVDNLSSSSSVDKENPTLHSVVAVVKKRSQMPTSETMGFANTPIKSNIGSPEMSTDLAGEQILAVSRARVFFERPKRANPIRDFTGVALMRDDNRKELGSLYNPYWQVRLTEPTTAEKMAALALSKEFTLGAGLTQ